MKIDLDKTGFPLVWVEVIGAWIHWLPVTKIQFEYFLSETGDRRFDADWYKAVLALNPRVTPRSIHSTNYWNAFITGLLPREAEAFTRWCGHNYSIPTAEQWHAVYQSFGGSEQSKDRRVDADGMSARCRLLLDRVDDASRRARESLGEGDSQRLRMLMQYGVMEWVHSGEEEVLWGGLGETHPDFHGMLVSPENGVPSRPNRPTTERIFYYGLRLIRKA